MTWPVYPSYKPTDIQWVGDVPDGWTTTKLRYLALLKSGESITSDEFEDDGEFPVYGGNGIRGYSKRFTHAGNYVLIGRQGALCGNINYADGRFWASEHAIVVSPLTEFPTFWLGELLRVMNLNQYSISAAQPGLSVQMIAGLKIPLPPIPDQVAIANFLEVQTGKIDRLTAKNRELIERLREKRTALISRIVTHGLPTDAATAAGVPENHTFKPSGVEWIGDIPAHWNVRRLRHISDTITVGVVVNPSSYVVDEGVPFLLGGDIREFKIDVANCNRCSQESSDGPLRKSRLEAGDLVVVRVGYPGIAAVVPADLEGANCASVMIVRHHERFFSQWLAYVFNSQSGRDQIEIVQYGAAQKQFNISHAVDFWFPFPPFDEQVAIASYLDVETAKVDALVAKVEVVIERLTEYRTALITAAVTGKIDVTKAAA